MKRYSAIKHGRVGLLLALVVVAAAAIILGAYVLPPRFVLAWSAEAGEICYPAYRACKDACYANEGATDACIYSRCPEQAQAWELGIVCSACQDVLRASKECHPKCDAERQACHEQVDAQLSGPPSSGQDCGYSIGGFTVPCGVPVGDSPFFGGGSQQQDRQQEDERQRLQSEAEARAGDAVNRLRGLIDRYNRLIAQPNLTKGEIEAVLAEFDAWYGPLAADGFNPTVLQDGVETPLSETVRYMRELLAGLKPAEQGRPSSRGRGAQPLVADSSEPFSMTRYFNEHPEAFEESVKAYMGLTPDQRESLADLVMETAAEGGNVFTGIEKTTLKRLRQKREELNGELGVLQEQVQGMKRFIEREEAALGKPPGENGDSAARQRELIAADTLELKKVLVNILEIDPKDYVANGMLGDVYYGEGDFVAARKLHLKALLNLDQGERKKLERDVAESKKNVFERMFVEAQPPAPELSPLMEEVQWFVNDRIDDVTARFKGWARSSEILSRAESLSKEVRDGVREAKKTVFGYDSRVIEEATYGR